MRRATPQRLRTLLTRLMSGRLQTPLAFTIEKQAVAVLVPAEPPY